MPVCAANDGYLTRIPNETSRKRALPRDDAHDDLEGGVEAHKVGQAQSENIPVSWSGLEANMRRPDERPFKRGAAAKRE